MHHYSQQATIYGIKIPCQSAIGEPIFAGPDLLETEAGRCVLVSKRFIAG